MENVELVRRMNAAFNRGDLDATFAFYERDAVWHSYRIELDDYAEIEDCVVTSGWVYGRAATAARRSERATRG